MMRRSIPGAAAVIVLIGMLLLFALWRAWTRPILRDDPNHSGPAATTDWPDMRIDVNRATAAELSVLPGLGPRLAERIVNDRERSGPFATLDEMTRVSGIGPAILERIRRYAVAESTASSQPAEDH